MLPSMFLDEDEEWMRSRRLICPSLHGKGVTVMIPSISHVRGGTPKQHRKRYVHIPREVFMVLQQTSNVAYVVIKETLWECKRLWLTFDIEMLPV